MTDLGLITHSGGVHKFKDDYLYFKFVPTNAKNMKDIDPGKQRGLPTILCVLLPNGCTSKVIWQENLTVGGCIAPKLKVEGNNINDFLLQDEDTGAVLDPDSTLGVLMVTSVRVVSKGDKLLNLQATEREIQSKIRGIIGNLVNNSFDLDLLEELYSIIHLQASNLELLVKYGGIKVLTALVEEINNSELVLKIWMILLELSSQREYKQTLRNEGLIEVSGHILRLTTNAKIKMYASRVIGCLVIDEVSEEEEKDESSSDDEKEIIDDLDDDSPRPYLPNDTKKFKSLVHPGNHEPPQYSWFFFPALRLLRCGKDVLPSDLWRLADEFTTDQVHSNFARYWRQECQKSKPNLESAMNQHFSFSYVLLLLYLFLFTFFCFVLPVLIPPLMNYFLYPDIEASLGYIYIVAIGVSLVLSTLFFYKSQWISVKIGLQMRSILMYQVYQKLLRIKVTRQTNAGTITNLFLSEPFVIYDKFPFLTMGYSGPLYIIGSTVYLYFYYGLFALIPFVILFIVAPATYLLSRQLQTLTVKTQIITSKRLKLVTDLVKWIRIIKSNVWQNSILEQVFKIRQKEVVNFIYLFLFRGLISTIGLLLPTLCSVIMILSYFIGVKWTVDPPGLIIAFAMVNIVRYPYLWFCYSIMQFKQNSIVLLKIQEFLMLPEKENYVKKANNDVAISIKNGTFQWDPSDEFILSNINLRIKTGQTVMLIGTVGCGKTSLLLTLLSEIPMLDGRVKVNGRIAYVSQKPWVFSGSIRENILLGEKYNKKWYEKVITAVDLWRDINDFWKGDDQEFKILEGGENISGGQKQRIALARALYANKDIYLLDDPTSALDPRVVKHVFHNVIQKILKKKTVIIATNTIKYAKFASSIICLDQGKIPGQGSFNYLLLSSSYFQSLVLNYIETEGAEEEDKENTTNQVQDKVQKPNHSFDMNALKKLNDKEQEEPEDKPVTQVRGLVAGKVWLYYLKSMSFWVTILLLTLVIAPGIFRLLSVRWLSQWFHALTLYTNNGEEMPVAEREYWALSYSGWLLGDVVSIVPLAIPIALWGPSASEVIFQKLLRKLSKARMSFYDSTPIGQIISTLVDDFTVIDYFLSFSFINIMTRFASFLTSLISVSFVSWVLFVVFLPILLLFGVVQLYYRRCNVELQRLESNSRSHASQHLSSTLAGLQSIHAYNLIDRFLVSCREAIDYNSVDKYALKYLGSFYSLLVDLIAAIYVTIIYLVFVLMRNGYIPAPEGFTVYAGVVISTLCGIMQNLSVLNQAITNTETLMNSVERIHNLRDIPTENLDTVAISEKDSFIENCKGEIKFNNFSYGYSKEKPILKKLSISIPPKSKVAIVGRTGAGKSSIFQALLQMYEPLDGTLEIDGTDIATLPLESVRRCFGLITQQSVTLNGTLRFNMNPLGLEVTDEQIWAALAAVGLKTYVSGLDGKLDVKCDERTFTLGQCQLLSLARASLYKAPILLLDEPTANVDLDTDATIQLIVRQTFKSRTVITVSHRLATIMDYDKILVLHDGRMVEFDTPAALISKKDGVFYQMVQATGPTTSNYLTKLALYRGKSPSRSLSNIERVKLQESLGMQKSDKKKKSKKEKKRETSSLEELRVEEDSL
eukprot:TRINITY_DN4845_c0_g3_i2.p1 TRINITY_DN4845_c0_g3~~TRINITY_DN4845_c0_g3_i2.p1  ORF type:complete len:1816 (-),score=379.04 TRINITY_DN4845_c0_g3_i2:25-4839(-)